MSILLSCVTLLGLAHSALLHEHAIDASLVKSLSPISLDYAGGPINFEVQFHDDAQAHLLDSFQIGLTHFGKCHDGVTGLQYKTTTVFLKDLDYNSSPRQGISLQVSLPPSAVFSGVAASIPVRHEVCINGVLQRGRVSPDSHRAAAFTSISKAQLLAPHMNIRCAGKLGGNHHPLQVLHRSALESIESSGGRRVEARSRVTDDQGRIVEFNYQAELAERHQVVHVDGLKGLRTIERDPSQPNVVVMWFEDHHTAQDFRNGIAANDILTSENHFRLPSKGGHFHLLLVRVVQVHDTCIHPLSHTCQFADTLAVILSCIEASPLEAFKDADINVTLRAHKSDYEFITHNPLSSPTADLLQRRTLQGSSKFLNFVKKGFTQVKTLGNAIKKFALFVQEISDGDLDNQYTYDLVDYNWNYDEAKRLPKCELDLKAELMLEEEDASGNSGFSGTCQRCLAFAQLSLNAELRIADYQVQRISIYVDGDAGFQYTFDTALGASMEVGAERQIAEFTLPDIQVVVGGIPFTLSVVTPITLGVEASASVNVPSIRGDLYASANLRAGVTYNAGGDLRLVDFMDYGYGGEGVQWPSLEGASGEAHIGLYLRLDPFFNVKNIGGPILSLKPSIESDYVNQALTGSVVLAGAIGGHLKIQLLGKSLFEREVEPKGIFVMKQRIGSVSLDSIGRRRRRLSQTIRVGDVYTGQQVTTSKQGCPTSPTLSITAQVVVYDSLFLTLLGSVNRADYNVVASEVILQAWDLNLYTNTIGDPASCGQAVNTALEPTTDPAYQDFAFQAETNPGLDTLQVQYGEFCGSVIVLEDSTRCFSTRLTLSQPTLTSPVADVQSADSSNTLPVCEVDFSVGSQGNICSSPKWLLLLSLIMIASVM